MVYSSNIHLAESPDAQYDRAISLTVKIKQTLSPCIVARYVKVGNKIKALYCNVYPNSATDGGSMKYGFEYSNLRYSCTFDFVIG